MQRKYIAPFAFFYILFSYGQVNYFPASGNVGIGTLTPAHNLEVAGSFSAAQIFINGSEFKKSPWIHNGDNTFLETGHVGIGTANPEFALDVAGTVNATNLLINGAPLQSSPWTISGTDALYNAGSVGIGTSNVPTGYYLAVAGEVIAEGVTVKLQSTGWPDFVFEEDYLLPSLLEVENFIKANGHLEHIPSALEVGKEGIELGQMDAKLLQKIEELTLYTIQQQKEIESIKKVNAQLMENYGSLMDRIEKQVK